MAINTLEAAGPEEITVADALHKANLIFDEVAFLGNSLPLPQSINVILPATGTVRISTFPQKFERADHAYLKLDCFDRDADKQGAIFLRGSKQEAVEGEWVWGLVSRPGSEEEPSEETMKLAEEYMVPVARAWSSLGVKGQDAQIDEWRGSLQDRKCRRIAKGLRHLRKVA